MQSRLAVKIGRLKLKNPVVLSSGTFGYGEELAGLADIKKIGAIVSKTITIKPRRGNPPPRTVETPCGLLNSIGLENPGVEAFINEKLPVLKGFGIPVIVSIASESGLSEFVELSLRLERAAGVAAIELNISCPNIRDSRCGRYGGLPLISQDAGATYKLVRAVRRATRKILITKLSPNVTCISDIARAAEDAGSDAVSLINTVSGMSIDVSNRTPRLGVVTGGLSGPAIRPIAVRMTWEVYQKIRIPIIAMGGIIDASSALEFIIAGATAVSIGTANFINPRAPQEIVTGINAYLRRSKTPSLRQLIGSLEV
ncbi:MAG: dihydroorotate dehydrogenase [Candidatus Omnitrophota bacterium]